MGVQRAGAKVSASRSPVRNVSGHVEELQRGEQLSSTPAQPLAHAATATELHHHRAHGGRAVRTHELHSQAGAGM